MKKSGDYSDVEEIELCTHGATIWRWDSDASGKGT